MVNNNGFSNFSDLTFASMAHSNWFSPSPQTCKEVKKAADLDTYSDQLIDNLYQNRMERGIAFTFHRPVAIVARLVVMIALQTVIAPLDVIYHLGKALQNRCVRVVTQDAKKLQSLDAEKKAHFSHAGTKLLFSASAIINVASFFFLTTYTLSATLNELAGRLLPLSIMFNLFITGGGASLSGDLFNSALPANLSTRLNQEMFYKYELGITDPAIWDQLRQGGPTLEEFSEDRALKAIDQIRNLQEALPNYCKLPFQRTPAVREIMDALENHRETLNGIGKDKWEEVKKLRDELCETLRQYQGVQPYLIGKKDDFKQSTFDNFEDELKSAFGDNDNKLKTPTYQLIEGLSATVFKRMLSSDWLYPSNCVARVVEQEIDTALSDTEFKLLGRRKIQSWNQTLVKKPLRALGRAVVLTGMGSIAAPLGIVYHTARSTWHGVCCLKGGDEAYGNGQKAKAHIWAMLTDLGITFSNIPLYAGLALYPPFTAAKIASFAAVSFLSFYIPLIGAALPEQVIPWVAYSSERPGLYKAIHLKNDFGLVLEKGRLLNYDKVKDAAKAGDADAGLWKEREKVGLEILMAVREVQCELAADKKLNIRQLIKGKTLNFAYIKKHVLENLPDNHRIGKKNKNEWMAHFEELHCTLDELKQLLEDCYIFTNRVVFLEAMASNEKKVLLVPDFTHNLDQCGYYFRPDVSKLQATLTHWNQEIEKYRDDYESIQIIKPSGDDLYSQFRDAIITDEDPPSFNDLLALPGQETDKANYRQLYLALHPDKNPDTQEEAQLLWNICKKAKELKELE